MKIDFITKVEVSILLIGILFVTFGVNINIKEEGAILLFERSILQNLLIGVGCSIVASSVVSYITTLYLTSDKNAKRVIETWGLKNIEIRSNLNSEINERLAHMDHGMDIVAFGMKNFLSRQNAILEEKVKKGCVIRILTMHPDSEFIARRDEEESNSLGQIKNEIKEMIKWAQEINNNPSRKGSGSIEIRGYKGLPQDMYQKVDDYVYVGPLQFGKPSQQTIAYAYKPGSKGAQYYTKYFLDLWKNDSFSEKIF